MYGYTYVCVRMYIYGISYIHTNIHTYIHTYIAQIQQEMPEPHVLCIQHIFRAAVSNKNTKKKMHNMCTTYDAPLHRAAAAYKQNFKNNKTKQKQGLTMKRITVPLGVLGIIFEARPDAAVQVT